MIEFVTISVPGTATEANPKGTVQKLPIRVGYFALRMMQQELKRDINTENGIDYEGYETLLYFALLKGHEKMHGKAVPFAFKKEDMADLMDDVFAEFMEIVPAFLGDQNTKVEAELTASPENAEDSQDIKK